MANYIGTPVGTPTLHQMDASSENLTLDLDPISITGPGKILYIIKTDSSANTVTIQPAGSETINGSSNHVLTTEGEIVTLLCAAGEWKTI